MQTPPETINTLKARVDEALSKKQWDGKSLFDSPQSFVMTSGFVRFLKENKYFDCPNQVECAVLVALAVIAENWPPQLEIIKKILTLLQARIPDLREQPRRAPEIAVAYVLGWPRPDLNNSEPRWVDGLKGAEWCLWAQIFTAVDSCLKWFDDKINGFHAEDPSNWVPHLLNLFTAAHFEVRCHCFLRGLAPGISFEDFTNPQGNAKARAQTCFHRHHLSVWDPLEMPLWNFAARAVQGLNGTFKSRWGEIPSGMLYDSLWHSEKRVVIVNVANRECTHCSKRTIYLSCECCGLELPTDPQPLPVSTKRWFILEQEELKPKTAWTCQLCGNIYHALHCDRFDCGKKHDLCPACLTRRIKTPHPTGRQRITRQVYFLELPTVDVYIDDRVQQDLPAPATDTSIEQLIVDVTKTVLDDFGQKRWIEKLLYLIEKGFVRWTRLLQLEGDVNWPELWQALSDAPDLPASPERLQEEFEEEIRPHLIEIFKFTFGLSDIYSNSINKHPAPTRTQRKEKEL